LAVPALHDAMGHRGTLTPARYVAARVADDLAYGAGVWKGCWQSRTLAPLTPHIALRSRTWSLASLRAHLKAPGAP
jgi:mycofactocin glycosyltransferase